MVRYNLAKGHPNASLVPIQEMQEVLQSVSQIQEKEVGSCLNYGPNSGDVAFKHEIASFLERHTVGDERRDSCVEDSELDLFITHGVSHGLDLLCGALTEPGQLVLVERPTYFLVSEIFRNHGLNISSLPMKKKQGSHDRTEMGGLDVDRLVQMVDTGEISVPQMIYLIPTHQNPMGLTIDVDDRAKLAELSARHNIWLVADEVYHLLDWRNYLNTQENRPARMSLWNNSVTIGRCISVSSFTKIFSPGIRCGWIEAPPHVIQSVERYGYIDSQGGCAPFVGLLMKQALVLGVVDSFLKKLQRSYCDQASMVGEILAQEPRIQVLQQPPMGGYFVWIQFPPKVDSKAFLQVLKSSQDVSFLPGSECDPFSEITIEDEASGLTSNDFRSCARLCFANLDATELREGVTRLVTAFQQYLIKP